MESERILVLAPLWRDAEVICQTLGKAGFETRLCTDMLELSKEIQAGAGAVVVTEEALLEQSEPLLQVLRTQPVWSDLPLTLLLAAERETPQGGIELAESLPDGKVTILTRPVPSATLVSVVNTALRARRRQYQVRHYLREREKQAEELERQVEQRTSALAKAGEEVRAARDLFHALFHSNPLPVAITRLADGLFLDVNDAYLRYFDYERQEVLGHSSRELEMWLPDPERDKLVAHLRQTGGVRNFEMQSSHPDGTTRTALVSIEVVNLDGTAAAISSFVDITERKRAEEQIRELALRLTMAESEERHRISRILHDDLQQQLYGIRIQLSMLQSALAEPVLLQELAEIEETLAMSIESTRTLSVDLSPPILHGEGLTEGLRWIASQMEKQYGLQVAVRPEMENSFPIPDDGRRVLLFQIVRELLFNAVKHAGISRVTVSLSHCEGEYCIEVRDEGEGFDPEQVLTDDSHSVGHGLARARERLRLVGGELDVDSTAGVGTRIVLSMPVAEDGSSGNAGD